LPGQKHPGGGTTVKPGKKREVVTWRMCPKRGGFRVKVPQRGRDGSNPQQGTTAKPPEYSERPRVLWERQQYHHKNSASVGNWE